MDAINFTEEPVADVPEENGRGRRRRASPLVTALRAIPPDERQAAIAHALREVEEEERRADLLARMQTLPTDAASAMAKYDDGTPDVSLGRPSCEQICNVGLFVLRIFARSMSHINYI